MSRYRVEILVTPRPGLLDPEGNAIHHALQSLGYANVDSVRVGKVIYLHVEADGESEAREKADTMCRKVLANPVTEDYEIQVLPAEGAEPAGAAADRGAGSAEVRHDGAGKESS
ncbi:MAG: phosphoribosylformylglycinamidine synthase subunit PurS [Longimicrobiales bacterium]|nr:phosphoribosylformylglycinamidine synthase subunit PurS [Longimicrobiales bacterium]